MNQSFKVVWSKARNAYVVVSELAKNSTKGCSAKKLLTMLIATGVMSMSIMGSAWADDAKDAEQDAKIAAVETKNTEQDNKITAVEKKNTEQDTSIKNLQNKFGTGAGISIGSGSNTAYSNSIAIGKGAYAAGNWLYGDNAIAIGSNAYGARPGSVTVGANSTNNGAFSTVSGSGNEINLGKQSDYGYATGTFATIYGSKNKIDNGTENIDAGVANSITGSVNTITNSNGVVINGTGNTVTNAYNEMVSGLDLWEIMAGDGSSIKNSNSGAVAVIGGGNTISDTTYNTTLGFKNTVDQSKDVFAAGSRNTLTNMTDSVIMGNDLNMSGHSNVISLGNGNTVSADKAVLLGANTSVTQEGGVALGADSVAGTEEGIAGYDPSTKQASTDTSSTWKSTAAAVSVGNAAEDITRQITGVAAGIKDTDAVNVAQLKKVATDAASAADTNTAKNDVTSISGSTDSDGTMTITQTTRTDTMSNGVWEKGEEKTTTITGIASTQYVDNKFNNVENKINKLDSRVDKVGAGAAALAALHPMDFDPDDKLQFSAGIGNYKGENAAAIGMFYRPDEKVLFSIGGTVGNDENMVNAGVTFSLDRTARVTNTKTAMAKEIVDLRAKVVELTATVEKMGTRLGTIDEDKVTLFPDIDENHWAYEYVGKLAAAGIIEGYPDGNFGGDRMMSRYEFAAMLYRAMQNGAQLDGKIVKEFAPEMGRIRVDRISGEDNDKRKVERVRTNGNEKDAEGNVTQYRDHYGSKITPASK